MKSKENKLTEKPIDLDSVLINELGQFGRFQLLSLLLLALPMIFSAFLYEYVFSAAPIPHRCRIPECDEYGTNTIYAPEWIFNAVPKTDNGFSSCWRYTPSKSSDTTSSESCPVDAFNQSQLLTCDEYVYLTDNSVVHDFNLGCQEWRRALVGTLNSVGTLLVMPISGFFSDRYGRRMTLVISVFNVALFGLIRAFSVNYQMYLAMQILQTTLGGAIFSTSYIFAAELVGPKYRMAFGATCSTMFSLGQVILGVIAWLVPNWRQMTLILFVPCFVFVSYYWFLPESIRWLLSKGKYEEATLMLKKVAQINRTHISDNSLRALTRPPANSGKIIYPEICEPFQAKKSNLVSKILSSPTLLRRVCTTPVWWISTTFIYYGLTIESTSLSDTMYLNYILIAAIEFPGFLTALLIINRIGRKTTLSGGYFLCAACNIAFAFIPTDRTLIRLLLYLLGKYGIATVFTSLYLYTSELYPTEYRHTLLAFSSMVGRLGSIVAPLAPVLRQYWRGLPSTLFGCFGLISGLLILTQPETLGNKLPDTLADAEALGTPEAKLKQLS